MKLRYILIIIILLVSSVSPVSAVWWNPFTWFYENENGEQILQGSIPTTIDYLDQNWYEWENTKTIKHAKLNITAPTKFTTCNISPDNGDGWDKCFAFVIVENNFNRLPKGIMNFNSIWKKGNVRNVSYQYTKDITDFQNKHEETNTFVPAKLFDNFSSELPDVEKGENFAVKILFEKRRWTEDSFDFKVSAGGEDIILDPDVSACGTLSTEGGQYTLTANLTNNSFDCITINANHISFNGNGFNITASGFSDAIYSQNKINITINNTNFYLCCDNTPTGIESGIHFSNVSNSTLYNNNIYITESEPSGARGIWLESNSNSNYLLNNSFYEWIDGADGQFSYGIYLDNSKYNIVSGGNSKLQKNIASMGDYFIGTSTNLTVKYVNFLEHHAILFNAASSRFNYSNFGEIFLETNISSSKTIFRNISSWTQSNITFSDNITSGNAISYYNISGLLPNIDYSIYINNSISSVNTTDSFGKLDKFGVPLITTFKTIKILINYEAPASITNLLNTTQFYSINWTWTNPSDIDFDYTSVYINGTLVSNTSNSYYLLNPISIGENYTISTHTVDLSGNVNTTWVNKTINTSTLKLFYPLNTSTGVSINTNLIWYEFPTNDSFTYHLSTDNQFLNIVSSGSGSDLGFGNGTFSSGIINLQYGTTYYWHVKNGTGSYVDSFEFTTESVPVIPGRLNISVWDEKNWTFPILNYTAQIYGTDGTIINISTDNGWINLSENITDQEYFIRIIPNTSYSSRSILVDSPDNATIYVPNYEINTIDVSVFTLVDYSGYFPWQSSKLYVKKNNTVMHSSYFSADDTISTNLIRGEKYSISLLYRNNMKEWGTYTSYQSAVATITVSDYGYNATYESPWNYSIRLGSIIFTWNFSLTPSFDSLTYRIYKNGTSDYFISTSINHGQINYETNNQSIYITQLSIRKTDGTFINSTQIYDKNSIPSQYGNVFRTISYGTWEIPQWLKFYIAVGIILILCTLFTIFNSSEGAIVTSIITLVLYNFNFLPQLSGGNSIYIFILLLSVIAHLVFKEKTT